MVKAPSTKGMMQGLRRALIRGLLGCRRGVLTILHMGRRGVFGDTFFWGAWSSLLKQFL